MNQSVDRQAVGDATGQGHFIGVFEFAAKSNTPGNGGNFYRLFFQLAGDVINSGIALNIGVEGKDDFLHAILGHALDQRFDVQLVWAHAVEWGDDATEHMVFSIELLGAFNRDNVADVFHHTYYLRLAGMIAADIALILVGDVEAGTAELNVAAQGGDGLAELFHRLFVLLDEVQHESEGGFLSDPG